MLCLLLHAVLSEDPIKESDWTSYRFAAYMRDLTTTPAKPLGLPSTAKWRPVPELTDEFDGTTLDESKWYDHNPHWRGRQPGYFARNNVSVKDGFLNLSITRGNPPKEFEKEGYKDIKTAAVQSVATLSYGFLEVRAKVATAVASSAFWLYKQDPDQWTEIDVFEIGGGVKDTRDKSIFQTVHLFKNDVVKDHVGLGYECKAPFRPSEGFHVYGLEWTPDVIRYFVDGFKTREGKNVHWHQPLWVNFDIETMPDWFGLPAKDDPDSTYQIDYIRVWKRI